ncbi:Magnesium transport protein CorA [Aquicella siphonis]|uniref:Magnesium transport protein CorA n=1 Tax=Aquicella siphonis TaxID=254247 RepID=A0A5E4PHG3_9COXI|nr:magnesium transporter CorA family protein [Aquicella siphonis]VVC75761.1 Magnesium transport protein CorA [Aquicella siphonis]
MTLLDSMAVEFDISNHKYQPVGVDSLEQMSRDSSKIYWVHCDLTKVNDFKSIAEKLHLPDDVIQLCGTEEVMPKLLDSGESLTIRLQSLISWNAHGKHQAQLGNLVIHLTSRYCLTLTDKPIPAMAEFTHSYPKALKYAKTPCFILFLILDNVINDYSEVLFDFELFVEKLDTKLRESEHNPYNDVMYMKKQVMKIKRYSTALRDILMRISGRKIPVVSEQCRVSLMNLFDHSQMIVGEADAIRDILNGTLDQIDNALMQQMNESMKVLTAFAAIFLPMTLIAGIYGMNFHWMPELQWRYGYFWALFLMFLCCFFLIFLFRKKKWL